MRIPWSSTGPTPRNRLAAAPRGARPTSYTTKRSRYPPHEGTKLRLGGLGMCGAHRHRNPHETAPNPRRSADPRHELAVSISGVPCVPTRARQDRRGARLLRSTRIHGPTWSCTLSAWQDAAERRGPRVVMSAGARAPQAAQDDLPEVSSRTPASIFIHDMRLFSRVLDCAPLRPVPIGQGRANQQLSVSDWLHCAQ